MSSCHPGGPGLVRRPSRWSVRCWEVLPEGWGVGRPTISARRGGEALLLVLEGSGVPPGDTGGVRRPTRRFGRLWKALPVGWDLSVGSAGGLDGPPGGPGGVGRPTLSSWRCRVADSEYQERSRSLPAGLGGVGRPTWMSGRGRESLLVGREVSGGIP